MKVPIFRAKDKDSDQWVEGFYVEFPSCDANECTMTHAIMVVIPDENSVSPNETEKVPNELVELVDNFTVNGEGGYRLVQSNTLMYCTIDITTLEKIKDGEIGQSIYYQDSNISVAEPKGIRKCLAKILRFFQ